MSAGAAFRAGVLRARRARRRARLGKPALPAPAYTHRGIELEILFERSGVLMAIDSDSLYWKCLTSDRPARCGFTCRPGCREHNWLELLGAGAELSDGDRLRVRIRPVLLADELDELER